MIDIEGWRPDGWNVNRITERLYLPCDENGRTRTEMVEGLVEAGADAMLEALKEKGVLMTPEQMKLIAPDRKYPYGWLVFIPDES